DRANGHRCPDLFLLASRRQHQLRTRDRPRATPCAKLALLSRISGCGAAGDLLADARLTAKVGAETVRVGTAARRSKSVAVQGLGFLVHVDANLIAFFVISRRMIRKLKSGEYRLYSQKKNSKT